MVLAPAFGESGRALFRRWGERLLGAVVSKLVFSFVLGALLTVLAVLASLSTLGWWTQWLLMSAFWWGAYTHRHHALGPAGAHHTHGSAGTQTLRRSLARRVGGALETPRMGIAAGRWAKDKLARPAAEVPDRKLSQAGRDLARVGAQEQVARALDSEHTDAAERVNSAPEIQRRLSDGRARLARLGSERASALAHGDTRRAAELGLRADRVQGEIDREHEAFGGAQRVVRDAERAQRRTGASHGRDRREARERFLDAQAALPASAQARGARERRDYAALAGLAGYGGDEYRRLDPRSQRAARLEIDRELALRRELSETAKSLVAERDVQRLGRRERRKLGRQFDDAVQQRMQEGGHSMPVSRSPRSQYEHWREAGQSGGVSSADRSSVMRDAFEVAARRKRQLGRDKP